MQLLLNEYLAETCYLISHSELNGGEIRKKRIDVIDKNTTNENRKRIQYKYKTGDKVLLEKGEGVQRKLYSQRTGPYDVIRIYPNGILKIRKGLYAQKVSIR